MKQLFNKFSNLYYIVFVVFLVASLIDLVSIPNIPYLLTVIKCIRYLCYLYFGCIVLLNIKKITFIEVFLVILCLLVVFFSKNKYILCILIIIMSSKYYDIKKLLKLSFYSILLLFAIVVVFSQIGIIPNWIFTREYILRHSLGFIYPTDCFSTYLVVVLLYFAVNNDNYKISYIILFEILNILLFVFTNGRLSFYLVNAVLLVMLLLKNNSIKSFMIGFINTKFIKAILFSLPFLFFFIFILFVVGYKNEKSYAYKIDTLLSDRVEYTVKAFDKNSVTPFGENITWYGWGGYGYNNKVSNDVKFEYNIVDSSYPKILLDYGIVLTIVILLAYSFIMLYYIKNKNIVMVFIFAVILLWSLIEPSIINIPKNIFILSFSVLLDRYYVFKGSRILKNEKDKR